MGPMSWKELLEKRFIDGRITDKDREVITQFLLLEAQKKGLRLSSMRSLVDRVSIIAEMFHQVGAEELNTVTTPQVLQVAEQIRTRYKINTQRTTLNVLKRVASFLAKKHGAPINCDEVKEIRLPPENWKAKLADDLLTPQEARDVVDAAETVRDRAVLALLYDAALRPIEARTLRWSQLIFDQYGIRMRVQEKTKYEREIRLTLSVPYLKRWKENYPDGEPTGNKYVFLKEKRVDGRYVPLGKETIRQIVKKIKEKGGTKKLKPSIFRPSSITHEAESGTDLTYILQKAWGNLATSMIRTYAKPGQGYMDRVALERMAGVELEGGKDPAHRTQARKELWQPRKCSCGTINPPGKGFCGACGVELSEAAKGSETNHKER